MDADLFDALIRTLVGRRLAITTLAVGLMRLYTASAKKRKAKGKHKRKHKHEKKKAECASDERLCGDRCIPDFACCGDAECRSSGECAGCQEGKCVPSDTLCHQIYNRCYACNPTSLACEVNREIDGVSCDQCRICSDGRCVDCRALGECAGCKDGKCVRDDNICTAAYGACQACDATFTCRLQGLHCPAGNEIRCCPEEAPCCNGTCCDGVCCGGRDDGYCYIEPGYICCSDAPQSGCPTYDRCCGDECVDFDSNQNHCGSCFSPCRANQRCVNGICDCAAYQSGTKWCEGAQRCILQEQICCGHDVCQSDESCCGDGADLFCHNGPTCP